LALLLAWHRGRRSTWANCHYLAFSSATEILIVRWSLFFHAQLSASRCGSSRCLLGTTASPPSGPFAALLIRARTHDAAPILLYPVTIPVIIAGVRSRRRLSRRLSSHLEPLIAMLDFSTSSL
jgi:ABC-type transport system involved in cytochrome c biogenesis permease component